MKNLHDPPLTCAFFFLLFIYLLFFHACTFAQKSRSKVKCNLYSLRAHRSAGWKYLFGFRRLDFRPTRNRNCSLIATSYAIKAVRARNLPGEIVPFFSAKKGETRETMEDGRAGARARARCEGHALSARNLSVDFFPRYSRRMCAIQR